MMKFRTLFSLLLVGGLMLSAMPSQAQEAKASQRFAGNGPSGRVSYQRSGNKLYHGIVLTVGGLVYSGDIAKAGPILKYGALGDNIGATATLNYKLTINPYVSMRFGAQVALLRGSNQKILKDDAVNSLHEFNAVALEPFVGVEVYPILNYGFFLYAGFGVTESFIGHYKHVRNSTFEENNVLGVLPMFQFGTGYNWWLDPNWTLGVELMGQIGVTDNEKIGLDGWPYADASGFNINADNPKRRQEEQTAYNKAKAPDGWFQLGLVISYHF